MKSSCILQRIRGGTLVLCLITLSALAFMAVFSLQRVAPKFQMAAQTAGWQEARLAAESGIDIAMSELQRNATGTETGSWTGWKETRNGVIEPASGTSLGLINGLLALLGGLLGGGGGGGGGGGVAVSGPIYLDNVNVAPPGSLPAELDVQLWAIIPTDNPYHRWFRIRSMATCTLPTPLAVVPDSLDTPLRRYSLRTVRPQLRKDDVGLAMKVPTPSSSRIVEVLVEPIMPFELAILTEGSLRLGTSGTWNLDSYDSRDAAKSNPDGTYPGKTSPRVQSNGNIASNLARPGDALVGPLIAAQGTRVAGAVATNGGDDPSTASRENVSGSSGIDPARVRDDFFREMGVPERPSGGIVQAPLLTSLLGGLLGGGSSGTSQSDGTAFVAGTDSSPSKYLVTKNLGAFTVQAPPGGARGTVIIMVNGDFDVKEGDISIPPNVTAQIYVRGNIDFHGNSINVGSGQRASQLQIYGEDSQGDKRTLRADGKAAICAAFYGPHYEVRLADEVEWCGAIAAKSFEMLGGGKGGLHYDEALATVGAPISFRIARYVEDVRE
jgi:hypothetical protein